jgi:hypothetical protein
MNSLRTLSLFNPPGKGLESLGFPLPGSLAIVLHVEAARTAELLLSPHAPDGLVLWSDPGAGAERAATDVIDVLARSRAIRPVLMVTEPWEAEPDTALAEVGGLPQTRRLDCTRPVAERARVLEAFLAPTELGTRSLGGARRTLSRLWATALRCYRHDRANALRRLVQLGSAGNPAISRYLAEHGDGMLASIGSLDSAILDAARWYLPQNEAVLGTVAETSAGGRDRLARLVRNPEAASFRSFLEGEERVRSVLAELRPGGLEEIS